MSLPTMRSLQPLSQRVARLMSTATTTTTTSASASTTSALKPYPFSKTALTPELVPATTTPNIPSLPGLKTGKGLMYHLRLTLPTPQKSHLLSTLFSSSHPSRVRVGDVLQVEMEHAPTRFTGVLLGVRRKGMDTSFTLRNVVNRTGVEVQVFVCSPHLKDVRVLRAMGKKSRKAKGLWMRDAPEKLSAIAGAAAAAAARNQQR